MKKKKIIRKMTKPLLSVVMPVYNAEKYLAEAIESVLNQKFKDFEFIIINDGSIDKSSEIVKKYAKKDKRIKILNNEKNMGIAETRNRGVREARGKYLAAHDSDDISEPERFRIQVDYLEKHPEVGIVGGNIALFYDKNNPFSVREYPEKDSELREMIFFACPIAQPVSMVRTEVFSKVGVYDGRYPPTEDLDLWFRIGEKYKFGSIPKVLLKYRESLTSATSSKTRLMEKLTLEIRFKNWNNKAYHFGLKAFLYNFFHLISLFIIPSKFKLWLFKKIRDRKND